jgi:heparan-alpha-glucosaminide N-acetyltransferase
MIPNRRLPAIDCFRALTMYLMIFVNDVAGVVNIPKWIGHTQAQEDGMGFADTIFPAFLFIVGLSLPHAIGNRLSKGQSFLQIALHLLWR